jgi:dihydroflavonol-4-reductase
MIVAVEFLITGATGLLGNNILRQLVEGGRSVRALVRATNPVPALAGLDVEVYRGDITHRESVEHAVRGVRCVIHAAGDLHIGWRHLERQWQVNVHGTTLVAQAARREGARLVHVSTVDTLPPSRHGRPVDEEAADAGKVNCTYVQTKREAEQVVYQQQQMGLDAVIVNPGFMLGPWDWKPSSGRLLLAVARQWIPAAPTGGVSGCDVREVARAIVAAADRGQPGRRYILAGENLSYFEAWKLFARITGRPGPICRTGPLVRLVAGRCGDLWGWITGSEPDVNSAMVAMSCLMHYYDSGRAERELGYRTANFADAAQAAWTWFRQQGYA